jgi:hypothetical protein
LQGFGPVAGLSYHLDVRRPLQNMPDAGSQDCMIINN